jgi:hypothetical protein
MELLVSPQVHLGGAAMAVAVSASVRRRVGVSAGRLSAQATAAVLASTLIQRLLRGPAPLLPPVHVCQRQPLLPKRA